MRVLVKIIQFPPDVNSTGRLIAQIGEGLVARGHEVEVITSFPHYEGFRVWEQYRRKLAQRDSYRGMDVLRLYVYAPGKKTIGRRFLSYLSFNSLAAAAQLISRRAYDVVLCTNGSFFTGLSAHVGGGRKGPPFLYNVQDLYPEVAVATGQLRSRRAIKILKRIEAFMYEKAAHITVITPSFKEHLVADGVPEEKISVIPNFVDSDFIRPLPKMNEFSRQHGLADRFVVAHAGNVGNVYDLDTMLQAARLLSVEHDIVFLIVGDGAAKSRLQRRATELRLENVRFLPFQPEDSLPWLRASADVQVSLYKRGFASYSMPSKVYEIMASGRPLLASADAGSDVADLVRSTSCGVCIEPEEPEQLADAIHALYGSPVRREAMGAAGRSAVEERYSRDVVVSSYNLLLQKLGKG